MKKIVLLALTAMMALLLCACGGSKEAPEAETDAAESTASAPEQTPVAEEKESFTPQTHRIAAGSSACAVLLDNGTVACSLDTSGNQYVEVNDEWKSWTDVVDISMNEEILVAAKADGTVVWCGGRSEYDWLADDEYMSAVDAWTDVVQVSASHMGFAALKADGTVEAIGILQAKDLEENGGFVQVSEYDALLCLREDGTVYCFAPIPYDGQDWSYDVSSWSGITQVSAGFDHAVGLKSDGTVVATGNNDCGQCDVSAWTDIVQVCAGREFTMGLKSDGSVVICGQPNVGYDSNLPVSDWSGMQEISGFFGMAMGLKADGTVVYANTPDYSNPTVSSVKG